MTSEEGVGDPDAFQRLWSPHRMAYIKGEGKPSTSDAGDGCPFCRIPTLPDDEGLIVHRGMLVYAVLNLYPYNAGHLMIVPFRHIADYTELTADEAAELTVLTQQALQTLRSASGAQGFNTTAQARSIVESHDIDAKRARPFYDLGVHRA